MLLIDDKICPKDLGMIPCNSYMSILPTIECVLPQPVCPYANIVPLYPNSTFSTKPYAVFEYTSYCYESYLNTLSYANDLILVMLNKMLSYYYWEINQI